MDTNHERRMELLNLLEDAAGTVVDVVAFVPPQGGFVFSRFEVRRGTLVGHSAYPIADRARDRVNRHAFIVAQNGDEVMVPVESIVEFRSHAPRLAGREFHRPESEV